MSTLTRIEADEVAGEQDGQGQHNLRVTATAVELARKLRWSDYKRLALAHAGGEHHSLGYSESASYWERVIRDVATQSKLPVRISNLHMETEARELSRILAMACLISRRWEASSEELTGWAEIQTELDRRVKDGLLDERHLLTLRQRAQAGAELIQEVVSTLPVFPSIALQAMQIASDPMAAGTKLEDTVNSDPVLAGEILKAANSPLYGAKSPIRTIRQAVLLIGMGEACRVIAASLFRPMFQAAALRPLWNHSLEVARLTESCARISGVGDPEEAFLAGLMHDVGRLAMLKTPPEVQARFKAMTDLNCEPVFSETLVFGFDHCAAGTMVLRSWQIPDSIVEAVGAHHMPERSDSPLASQLYLAECWSQSLEHLSSAARFQQALLRAGLNPDQLKALPQAPALLGM